MKKCHCGRELELRGTGCACDELPPALHPVRSEPLLAEAIAAIKALAEALECYTSVHGADEDDDHALALGRDVLRKANPEHQRSAT